MDRTELGYGFVPQALAAESGKVFVLIDDEVGRTVRVAEGGKLHEVARAPNEPVLDLNPSNLLVDASGYFFDVYQNGKKWLIGAPRQAGSAVAVAQFTDSKEPVDPPFVGDAASIYLVGTAPGPEKAILRVPRIAAMATSPVVLTDYTAFYNGLTAIAVSDSGVYAVNGATKDYVAREFPKDPDMPPRFRKSATFVLPICTTFAFPPHLIAGTDALYLGCQESGGAQQAIYRLPPSQQWPADENGGTLGPAVASGKVAGDTFIVVGTTVYFADYEQDVVFKVPGTGGTPTRVLSAYNVEHMASDGATLFVQSGCGIQSAPL